MEGKFDKLIDKLTKSEPILNNPDRLSSDIMEKISEQQYKNNKGQSYIRLFAKVAAVSIFILSTGLLIMQEWQANHKLLSMREVQSTAQYNHQPSVEATDCKQLIKNTLNAVVPDVKVKVDKSKRIVEFEGEEERLAIIENYLEGDLNLSNDGKYYLTENDIKAFGITCKLF